MSDARSNTPILSLKGFKKAMAILPFLRPFFILRQAQDKLRTFVRWGILRQAQARGIFILFTAFIFLFNSIGGDLLLGESWAAKVMTGLTSVGPDNTGSPAPLKELNADTFMLPQELGYIQEISKAPNSSKTVVQIQDAHCNYFAQKQISQILNYLTSEYGVSAVNCEGGKDNYDLNVFTSIEEKDVRGKVSDFFVKEGVVNAAEFFAVNNPGRAKLWGVEDAGLYIKNLKVYRESLSYKDEAERDIKSISRVLNSLKERIYSPELLSFDNNYMKYKDNQITFKEYVSRLIAAADKNIIDVKSFPDIYLLGRTLREEENINFKRSDNEKDEVVDKLKKILSKRELEELMIKAGQMKTEHISQGEFYAYLAKKAKSIKLDMKNYPELERYIVYISVYSAIDRTKITKELGMLEDRIKESLYKNDTQRDLGALSKNIILEKNMFNISLTRDDYNYYKEHRASFNVVNFTRFIDAQGPLYKIQARLDGNIGLLDEYREKMEAFYECSLERDRAFVKNIKFTDNDRPNSIIITGGFHTQNLRELFKNENVSYISIMPKFTNPPGYESPYLKRLAGQSTALENVIDTAIPAALNLQVVNILSQLAPEVEGQAGIERFRLAVLIMTALERGNKFILKIRGGAIQGREQETEKFVTFAKAEGAEGIGYSQAPASSAGFNAELIKLGSGSFVYTVNAPPHAGQPSSTAPAPEAEAPRILPPVPGTPVAAATEEERLSEAAKTIIPEMAQSLRRGSPTYLLSPAVSDEDTAPEASNNRQAEQILGKQGQDIHAKNYPANGEDWAQDMAKLKYLLRNTLPDFVKDAQSNRFTRMAVRVISDNKGERIEEVRAAIKDMLMKNFNLNSAEAQTMITNQIRFVPINISNVRHVNASIDLFTDIGMMEIDRYLRGDYPGGELPAQLKDRFLALLKLSITNFNDIMKLVKTEEDIGGILDAIFKCNIILQIKPVDWKSVDRWKNAQKAILSSL